MAFSNGDKVTWKTSQGSTEGVVKQKRVTDFEFKGQTFRPTVEPCEVFHVTLSPLLNAMF